jgi:hypothetical protein
LQNFVVGLVWVDRDFDIRKIAENSIWLLIVRSKHKKLEVSRVIYVVS